jgi:hypothetical protein
LTALLDSGGSGSMICAKHTSDLKKTSEGEATTWSTPAGDLSTKESCTAQILLPELQSSRGIEWKFHVAPSLGNYDMIIGRDMLTDLGIDIRFSDNVIGWDGAEMPLKEFSGGKCSPMHSTWKNRLLCKTFSIVASLKTNTKRLI